MNKTSAKLAGVVAVGMMVSIASVVSLCVSSYQADLNTGGAAINLVAWGTLLGLGVCVTCGCMVALSRQVGLAPRIGDR